MLRTEVETYFKLWNDQDLNGLRKIFDPNIVLKDWENYVEGIDAVIEANQKIFSEFPNINIETVEITLSQKNKAFAELIIHLDEMKSIEVMDVLSFNGDMISFIKAFKI